MLLDSIRLINFKNYKDSQFKFEPGINCILGPNGCGKTTLLDSIHYLSLTRSAFNSIDSQNIKDEHEGFSIKGQLNDNNELLEISCIQYRGKKKSFRFQGSEYERLSDHIGTFPVVFVAPDDISIINEGSETRRRFFDSIISQVDKQYLETLIEYNHLLKQRNSYLKYIREKGSYDVQLLDTYDPKIVELSKRISHKRFEFLNDFNSFFQKEYKILSSSKEVTEIIFESAVLEEDFKGNYLKNRQRDLDSLRTNLGAHKDKWLFLIHDKPVKNFGSQGQKKSFFLALKLAQFEYVYNRSGKLPILLLDDIFDKLDDQRIEMLMNTVSEKYSSQVLITDARPERTENILNRLGLKANLINIDLNYEKEEHQE